MHKVIMACDKLKYILYCVLTHESIRRVLDLYLIVNIYKCLYILYNNNIYIIHISKLTERK